MHLSNKQLRDFSRAIHLIGAVVLLAFIYASQGEDPTIRTVMQIVVFPILILTGIAMWQLPHLTKRFRAKRPQRHQGIS
jgi:thiosulfate reductase cytochrome b subunit